MSVQTKEISKAKWRQIGKRMCDGVPRYKVKGSVLAIALPYGTAYEETFRQAGGTYEPPRAYGEAPGRVWTKEGMRRVARLNAMYEPHGRRFFEAMKAARELTAKPAAAPAECPPSAPPSTSS